ncbi:MAG: hypothetical protein RSB86_15410, partial [Comamonas sp.]
MRNKILFLLIMLPFYSYSQSFEYSRNSGFRDVFPSGDAACADLVSSGHSVRYDGGGCDITKNGLPFNWLRVYKRVKVCESGNLNTAYIPFGWAKYYTGNSGQEPVEGGGSATPVGSPVVPSSICSEGCSYSVGAWQAYINFDAPSGSGAYQIVAQASLTGSGSSCTENTDLTAPTEAAPACEGTVGYVNGKQYCAASQGGGETGGGETGGGETGGGETGGGET